MPHRHPRHRWVAYWKCLFGVEIFRGDFITWVHAVVLGTDEIINFEVNCELSTQQSIRDSDGIGFGTFTFFRIVGRVLNEELMMS